MAHQAKAGAVGQWATGRIVGRGYFGIVCTVSDGGRRWRRGGIGSGAIGIVWHQFGIVTKMVEGSSSSSDQETA